MPFYDWSKPQTVSVHCRDEAEAKAFTAARRAVGKKADRRGSRVFLENSDRSDVYASDRAMKILDEWRSANGLPTRKQVYQASLDEENARREREDAAALAERREKLVDVISQSLAALSLQDARRQAEAVADAILEAKL